MILPKIQLISPMSSNTALLSRERCQCCKRYSLAGFSVPNHIWDQAIPNEFHESPLCIMCFAAMADERLIEWSRDIEFFPVSLAEHARDNLGWTAPEKPTEFVFKGNLPMADHRTQVLDPAMRQGTEKPE